jgi:DNA end-binding protein Ku
MLVYTEVPMPRPYWSGQIQISLVSFGVKLFVATEAKSEIRFHQVHRGSGERVRHQKVSFDESGDAAPIEKDEIVKGYEYRKGEYITIEPEEIEHLRIPSKRTMEVTQFVGTHDLPLEFFEKPYFLAPEDDAQAEAFNVVRKALAETKKAGLGKIAFGGREHLIAIMAPEDEKLAGLMAYGIRYAEELRDPKTYFVDVKKTTVAADQLALAKELIKRKSAKFDPSKFTDDYEAALRELVESKVKNQPLPVEEKAPARGKVINLMDALRKSISGGTATRSKPGSGAKKGIALVKPIAKSTPKHNSRRKSA